MRKTLKQSTGQLLRIEEIKNSIAEYEKNTVRTDKFVETVRKYQDCEQSTDEPTGKKKAKVS